MTVDRRAWAVVGVVGSIHFVQHVFRILPPLLPFLALSFSYPLWQLGGLVSLYFTGSGFGQAPMGVVADRYDRRLLVPPSVAVMGAGYLLFAFSPQLVGSETVGFVLGGAPFTAQFLLMGTGALIAGLGASAVHPCGYPLVIANATEGHEGRLFGVWASAAKLGDAAAPMAIAVLVLFVPWSEVFLLFGTVGVLYGVVLFLSLSSDLVETRTADQRRTGPTSDADPDPQGSDANDGASAIYSDRRHYVYPFVVLSVFFLARAFSEKGLKAFLPTFIVTVYGYTYSVGSFRVTAESFADVYFSTVFVVAAVATLVIGRLVDRFDARTVLVTFFLVAAGTTVGLATGGLSRLTLLAVLVVLGASNWGLAPARDAVMSEITPPGREGRTFGYLHTVSHLFSAVAPVAIGFVAGTASLQQSFRYLAVVMLVAIAAIASLFSRRVYRPVDYEQAVESD